MNFEYYNHDKIFLYIKCELPSTLSGSELEYLFNLGSFIFFLDDNEIESKYIGCSRICGSFIFVINRLYGIKISNIIYDYHKILVKFGSNENVICKFYIERKIVELKEFNIVDPGLLNTFLQTVRDEKINTLMDDNI